MKNEELKNLKVMLLFPASEMFLFSFDISLSLEEPNLIFKKGRQIQNDYSTYCTLFLF